MGRDRTGFYLSLKSSLAGDQHEVINIESSQWKVIYKSIIFTIEEIEKLLIVFAERQSNDLVVSFGKPKPTIDNTEIKNQTDDKIKKSSDLFNSLRNSYKKDLEKKVDGDTEFDRSFFANLETFLINKINTLIAKRNTIERKFSKLSEQKESKIKKYSSLNEVEDVMRQDAEVYRHSLEGRTEAEIEEITRKKELAKQKEKQYTQIENEMKQLVYIQQDLHTMILDQGTILDTLEYNMNITRDKIVSAKVKLKEAQKIQAKVNYNNCCCYFVILVFIMILILVRRLS